MSHSRDSRSPEPPSATRAEAMPDGHLCIDARGLLCPLPVLRARKRLGPLPPGSLIWLVSDDPAAVIDVPHFSTEAGHELLEMHHHGAETRFLLRKGRGAESV